MVKVSDTIFAGSLILKTRPNLGALSHWFICFPLKWPQTDDRQMAELW
jgi:hypothetical protein